MKDYALLVLVSLLILGCAQTSQNIGKDKMENMKMDGSEQDMEFKQMCESKGWEWMPMKPTMDGKIMKDAQECWGCMVEGIEHVCDKEKFMDIINKN